MYTPMVNEQGKLVGDNLVTRVADDAYRWTTDNMGKWLEHVREVGKFNTEIEDIRADFVPLQFTGTQINGDYGSINRCLMGRCEIFTSD